MPVAVVTGSSSGIGFATATLLVERGYSVVLHGNSKLHQLQSAAGVLRSKLAHDAELLCLTGDISDEQTCHGLVESAFKWHQRVDLWVNNAGADVLTGPIRGESFEAKLKRLIDVDVIGTIRLSRLVAEQMANQQSTASSLKPVLINIGWDQALLGMEGDSGQMFCASKAAVMAFTNSLALSAAPHVRVNTVAPGWIRTAWGQETTSDYWSTRAVEESQMNRWGMPDDVAETIAWLASPSASFISGQTISVNGGRRFYPLP